MIDKNVIKTFFRNLNSANIGYLLIRNINDELPGNLDDGKDIDILIDKNHEKKLEIFLEKEKLIEVKHPSRKDTFLYNVTPFRFFKNSRGLVIDISYQLCCRSLNAREWICLDQKIQGNAWRNQLKKGNSEFQYQGLNNNEYFVCLLTRCIFDKKRFTHVYQKEIKKYLNKIDEEEVKAMLELVFFKYTPTLLKLIKANRFDGIIKSYITFKEY